MLRNTIYYSLKPFIPRTLRTSVRRSLAGRLRRHVGEVWPIMPGSERPPEGWHGWPEARQFALILTHDVEGPAGLEQCRALMQAEMELGFRSSFNFVPEGSYRVPVELRHELQQNGFEVCVHDLRHDGRLFRSSSEFRKRARRINSYLSEWGAVGFRAGFMLHNLDWLHQLQMDYDMSTFDTDPFEPQPEGRHTIFPFWVPAPATQEMDDGKERSNGSSPSPSPPARSGYIELPYTLPQDSTLFLLLGEKTSEVWQKKVDWLAERGGMVLLDTHPDYMSFSGTARKGAEYPVERYLELLRYIRSKYAGRYWHALPRQVAAHAPRPVSRSVDRTSIPVMPSTRPHEVTSAPLLDPKRTEPGTVESHGNGSADHSNLRGKRVGVLLFSYYPADPRPRRAAEALAAQGATVDLICLQNEGAKQREVVAGINVVRVPLKRFRGTKVRYIRQYSAFLLACFWELTRRSFSRRYDLIHVHNMPDVLVFSALVPKLLGAKLILDLHDPMPELMRTIFGMPESSAGVRLLKYLERRSIGFVDLVFTVNRACKRIYSSRSCSPEKITVIMNAPEDQIFQFTPPLRNGVSQDAERPFLILYHGSLVPRNGFDLAVDALALVRDRIPKAQLMVCGERSAYFDEVMESAQKQGVSDLVHYLGLKNRREMADLILRCDIGVVPNHRNTFTDINTPTRIFEYLSLGKPVIAPRTVGIVDYFADDELIFFEAGDARDLARQIEFAYANRDRLPDIVERGQRIYLENAWGRQKSNLLSSVDQLLQGNGVTA